MGPAPDGALGAASSLPGPTGKRSSATRPPSTESSRGRPRPPLPKAGFLAY